MAADKTDVNDADGLAHLTEVGFYKEERVKCFDSMLARTLVAARTRLVRMGAELSNQIRGLIKTFGLIVPPVMGSKFERHVEALLVDNADLARIIRPLPGAPFAFAPRSWDASCWRTRGDAGQLLMSIPGIGVVTAPASSPRSRTHELQALTIGRSLGRADHPALPVRRNRL